MIQSQPKSTSLVAVGLFLMILVIMAMWLMIALINNPSQYFLLKLILVPLLFVIAIIVSVKTYSSAIFVTAGNNKITYRYLVGLKKTHKVSDISNWKEEVIKQKNTEYRRLSIQFTNRKKLLLSNQENAEYKELVNYLKKKVRN